MKIFPYYAMSFGIGINQIARKLISPDIFTFVFKRKRNDVLVALLYFKLRKVHRASSDPRGGSRLKTKKIKPESSQALGKTRRREHAVRPPGIKSIADDYSSLQISSGSDYRRPRRKNRSEVSVKKKAPVGIFFDFFYFPVINPIFAAAKGAMGRQSSNLSSVSE